MKRVPLKDSTLKTWNTPADANNTQSQSPTHKKLLKKIENIQSSTQNVKCDLSLQEKPIHTENKEKKRDFRAEIEHRFNKSGRNSNYSFPLRTLDTPRSESTTSSDRESIDLLQYTAVYDLASQNKRKKACKLNRKVESNSAQTTNPYRESELHNQPSLDEADGHLSDRKEEIVCDMPIEISIRDKSSAIYKSVIGMLESNRMFSHNITDEKHHDTNLHKESKSKAVSVDRPKTSNQINPKSINSTRNMASPTSRNIEIQCRTHLVPANHRNGVFPSTCSNKNQRLKQRGVKSELDSILAKSKINSQTIRHSNTQIEQMSTSRIKNLSYDTFNKENWVSIISEPIDSVRSKINLKKALSCDKTEHLKADSISELNNNSSKNTTKRSFHTKM